MLLEGFSFDAVQRLLCAVVLIEVYRDGGNLRAEDRHGRRRRGRIQPGRRCAHLRQRPLSRGHDWGMSSGPERKTPAHAGANDFFDMGSPIIAAPFDVKCRTPGSRSACRPTSTTASSASAIFTGTLAMFQRAGFTEIGRTYPTGDETHTDSPPTDLPARQIRAPSDPSSIRSEADRADAVSHGNGHHDDARKARSS